MDREAVVASIVALLFCHSLTRKIAVFKLALVDFWMNRFIPIIHEIIVVLQRLQTNKMKSTFRELRETLSDMAKNVPEVAKNPLDW